MSQATEPGSHAYEMHLREAGLHEMSSRRFLQGLPGENEGQGQQVFVIVWQTPRTTRIAWRELPAELQHTNGQMRSVSYLVGIACVAGRIAMT
jgi:hypothetical protein